MSTLTAQVEPAPDGHVGFWVKTMANTMAMRNGQTQQMASRTDGWLLACGHLPADLWTEGCTELLKSKTFMPSPGELMALVGNTFELRRRMLNRASHLLELAKGPEQPKPASRAIVPKIDQLRKLLREQIDDTSIPEDHRQFNAANTERSLALFEKRSMEPWARDVLARMPSAQPARADRSFHVGAAARSVMTTMQKTSVEPWQYGEPLYHQPPRLDEPPPHEDIPEAMEM